MVFLKHINFNQKSSNNRNPLENSTKKKQKKTKTQNLREIKRKTTYQKVEEIDDCPRHARRAAEDGENKEPCEEENEDVGGPHTRVREPLRVPVQIRRRLRFHVQICHPDSDLRHTIFRFVDLPPFAFDFGFIVISEAENRSTLLFSFYLKILFFFQM